MDPNQVLKDARAALHEYISTDDDDLIAEAAVKIIEGFQVLDQWLSKGGFLPNEWRRTS